MTATEDKSYYIARTKLAEYLDNRRLRKTPERFAILEAVFSHNDHFGIEALLCGYGEPRVSRQPIHYLQHNGAFYGVWAGAQASVRHQSGCV